MPIIYKFIIHISKQKKKAISDCSWIGGSAICPLTEKTARTLELHAENFWMEGWRTFGWKDGERSKIGIEELCSHDIFL